MEQPTQNFNPALTGYEELIKAHLSGTKGWLMFMGVLNIVVAALLTIATLGIGVLVAWIPFILGLFLVNASNRIKGFLITGNEMEMVNYHKQIKNFFMTTGIITIISFAINIIVAIVMLSIGMNGNNIEFLNAFK